MSPHTDWLSSPRSRACGRGRSAVYRECHLERLRVIAELQDRGLTLSAIRHLLGRRASPGISVGDWLGLDETLRGPWSEDGPKVVGDDELADVLGTRSAGLRTRLGWSRYLERQPDGSWLIRSPALLDLALQLQDAGIDVELTGRATELLRRRLARAVDDLIMLFAGRTASESAGGSSMDELAKSLRTFAPLRKRQPGSSSLTRSNAACRDSSRKAQLPFAAVLSEAIPDVHAETRSDPPNRRVTTRSSAPPPDQPAPCGCRESHPARSRDQSVSMDQTEDSVVATQPRRLGIVDWRR
jgi:DNA-binding transcriptional MerR regulator